MELAHSFNEGQIEWFKAGSALNLVCSSNAFFVNKITDA